MRGKVWRPKQRRTELANDPENVKPETCTPFSMEEEERTWVERCAAATCYSVQSRESLQEGLQMQGLSNFKIKLLGAHDMILEFESKEEMEITLTEAASMLEEFFEWIKPCEALTVGRSQLVWVRLWKVPLGVWMYDFFNIIGDR